MTRVLPALVVGWSEAATWVLCPCLWGLARAAGGPLGPEALCVLGDVCDECCYSMLMLQLRFLSLCRLGFIPCLHRPHLHNS